MNGNGEGFAAIGKSALRIILAALLAAGGFILQQVWDSSQKANEKLNEIQNSLTSLATRESEITEQQRTILIDHEGRLRILEHGSGSPR